MYTGIPQGVDRESMYPGIPQGVVRRDMQHRHLPYYRGL